MTLDAIRNRLSARSILHGEDSLAGRPTVIGYDKQFRWRWLATQLNTFVVASDFGDEEITVRGIEAYLTEAFQYAKEHYTGWPRGLQSGVGVIGILLSSAVSEDAKFYCRALKTGKKWSGFSIPVVIDTAANEVVSFEKNPVWGRIYYPYFRALIDDLTAPAS